MRKVRRITKRSGTKKHLTGIAWYWKTLIVVTMLFVIIVIFNRREKLADLIKRSFGFVKNEIKTVKEQALSS